MKRLEYRRPVKKFRYPADIDYIARIVAKNSYVISPYDIQDIWEDFSESMCAGWLSATAFSEEEILNTIKSRCECWELEDCES